MRFTWDENKNKANIKKHGIPFKTAIRVFDDINRVERYDEYHSDEEDRYQVIGMVGNVITVIVTYHSDDETRIISARRANRNERRIYYGDCQ